MHSGLNSYFQWTVTPITPVQIYTASSLPTEHKQKRNAKAAPPSFVPWEGFEFFSAHDLQYTTATLEKGSNVQPVLSYTWVAGGLRA